MESTARVLPATAAAEHPVIERLERLRAVVGATGSCAAVEALVADAIDGVQRILSEQGGMVDELLRVYEQLGVVFDVTRKLAGIQDEQEVIRLFLQSLEECFAGRPVAAVGPIAAACDDRGAATPHAGLVVLGAPVRVTPWLAERIDAVRCGSSAVVEPVVAGAVWDDIEHIMLAPVFSGARFVCAIVVAQPRSTGAFRSDDMLLVESLASFCGDIVLNLNLVQELREVSMSMVRALVNAVDQKDEYTSGHSVRVAYYATLLARQIGLDATDVQMVQWSALLHDIGKIGIRDAVLKKSGRLTADEFSHIKEHPCRSYQVVREVPQLAKALDGVRYHHEHYDGGGYPDGLVGTQIPLQARIIQIADVFDALTSNRSYRGAFDWEKALDILRDESGTTVDPELQPVFDRIIRRRLADRPNAWRDMVATASSFAGGPHGADACGEQGSDASQGQAANAGGTRAADTGAPRGVAMDPEDV
ncbi:MAG: HD-GYP domain-containing protein [Phycisphaerae bacterium]